MTINYQRAFYINMTFQFIIIPVLIIHSLYLLKMYNTNSIFKGGYSLDTVDCENKERIVAIENKISNNTRLFSFVLPFDGVKSPRKLFRLHFPFKVELDKMNFQLTVFAKPTKDSIFSASDSIPYAVIAGYYFSRDPNSLSVEVWHSKSYDTQLTVYLLVIYHDIKIPFIQGREVDKDTKIVK